MFEPLNLLDFVVLVHDRPRDGLIKGQRGTVVEVYEHPRRAYEVEFVDGEGYTVALITAGPDELQLIEAFQRN